MKKAFALIIALVFCLSMLTACGSTGNETSAAAESSTSESGIQLDNNQNAEPTNTQSGIQLDNNQNTEVEVTYSEADIEVTGEYIINDTEYENAHYVLIIKNNAPVTLEVTAKGLLTRSNGSTIEDEIDFDPIAPGEEYLGAFYMGGASDLESASYTFECKESTYYRSLNSEVSVVSATQNDRNVVLGFKNNGSENAEIRAAAVFLDEDGNALNYAHTSVGNKCGEILPGDTLYCELDNTGYDTYANARVFYTAYIHEQSTVSSTTPADFDVNCYRVENSSSCIFTVTNNSQQAVEVRGNVTGLDKAGTPIAADYFDIRILGPGETIPAVVGMFTKDDVADITYTVMCNDYTNSHLVPVVGNLEASVTDASEKSFSVSVTNNGQDTAEGLYAYILLFDADGTYVGFERGSVDDLQPNDTVSVEISNYKEYDHYELYLEGYGTTD